jgi:hypothetical protein
LPVDGVRYIPTPQALITLPVDTLLYIGTP